MIGESTYEDDQKYVTTFNNDPLVAAWTEWTWKQVTGFPALQAIQHTAASQKLIDWINDPSRPQPTPTEAAQGMSDFIRAIRFENTAPDAKLRSILTTGGTAMPAASVSTTATAPSSASVKKPAVRPSTAAAPRRVVACARVPRKTKSVRPKPSRGRRAAAPTQSRSGKQRSTGRRSSASPARCQPRVSKKRPAAPHRAARRSTHQR